MSEAADKPKESGGRVVPPVEEPEHGQDVRGTPKKREGRRFSFSLRTLMIVVLLVGVVLAPLAGRASFTTDLILGGSSSLRETCDAYHGLLFVPNDG